MSALSTLRPPSRPSPPRLQSLLQLRGGVGTPVFMAHGLGGSVVELFDIVRHLDVPNPVYGLQARGIDGITRPLATIEEMAQFHLWEIRQVQPRGPYVLIGYSLGGLVTLEIARTLHRAGESIALLTMVDSYPHACRLAAGERTRLLAKSAKRGASKILNWTAARDGDSSRERAKSPVESTAATQRIRRFSNAALKRYRPRFYQGQINFVRAETVSTFSENPVAVWGRFAAGFSVETVPGDHLEMITTHSHDLAAVLSRQISGC